MVLTLYSQLLNHVMENYCPPQQHGVLQVPSFTINHVNIHKLVSTYAVLSWQIVQ